VQSQNLIESNLYNSQRGAGIRSESEEMGTKSEYVPESPEYDANGGHARENPGTGCE
jgi:hypothetical protein